MGILVTGAGGMLGRDVVAVAAQRGHEVLALSHDELDVTNGPRVDAVVARFEPDAVVNCAAWTDVDGAESREREAMAVNDTGAGLLSVAAGTVGAKIVYPSTDYVFDGSKGRPYVESDVPSPISAYGRSKLAGETAVAVANSRHFIVRTSWLFGSGGHGQGGGIWNGTSSAGTPSTLTLLESTIVNNRAEGGAAGLGGSEGQGVGGGIYLTPGSIACVDLLTVIFGNEASTSDDDVYGTLPIC